MATILTIFCRMALLVLPVRILVQTVVRNRYHLVMWGPGLASADLATRVLNVKDHAPTEHLDKTARTRAGSNLVFELTSPYYYTWQIKIMPLPSLNLQ